MITAAWRKDVLILYSTTYSPSFKILQLSTCRITLLGSWRKESTDDMSSWLPDTVDSHWKTSEGKCNLSMTCKLWLWNPGLVQWMRCKTFSELGTRVRLTSTWIWRGGHLPNAILASLVNSGKGCCALNVSRIPAILSATLLLLSFPCKISFPPSFPKTNLLRNSKWLQEVECWSLFSVYFLMIYPMGTCWILWEKYEKIDGRFWKCAK